MCGCVVVVMLRYGGSRSGCVDVVRYRDRRWVPAPRRPGEEDGKTRENPVDSRALYPGGMGTVAPAMGAHTARSESFRRRGCLSRKRG